MTGTASGGPAASADERGVRPVAVYLPQFHPIPENDAWWGEGFTEWTSVRKARPLFPGHYQPREPGDMGYYDLRSLEALEAQAALARRFGVHGFAFYHYWFGGKRLLHEPLDRMLATGRPRLPFLLFWANESWSRRWMGEERAVLMKQEYSREDHARHAAWLCEHVFADDRYIRVAGRPVFVVYRPADIPELARVLDLFREVAVRSGHPGLFLVGSNAHSSRDLAEFDAVLHFEPQLAVLPHALGQGWSPLRLARNLRRFGIFSGQLRVFDYAEAKWAMKARPLPDRAIPCPFVGWDNTPRRGGRGIVVSGEDPKVFEASLRWAREVSLRRPREERFVFINAWNEWAEGNHLEPCRRFGTAFLECVERVFAHE